MKWITRDRPKIDRIACPWLIRRFIDSEATFHYVPFNEVMNIAIEIDAIPFDIPNVELSHYADKCTFDKLLEKYDLKDPALFIMAPIIRGADTDVHHLASQAAGLWSISAGMAFNIRDDQELLTAGMVIYDALYSWAKYLKDIRHTQNPIDYILLDVYHKFLKQDATKKIPEWAKDIKDIIQDQLDFNLNINLKDISSELNVHPAYLSREFSKHFDDLSFGEYIRKLRIDKAVSLLENPAYSLSEIAYLTGFSDQSHFTRIFKKQTGQNPSIFRKNLQKGKKNTKG